MWAIASTYLFYDLHCACLKCYGPNVVLLHRGVPVHLWYLRVGAITKCFRNALCCITYHLQVPCTHKLRPVPHVELQDSACCKFQMGHVWVSKSMEAVTTGDHWFRCRLRLRLQLPLPLWLIPFFSWHSQWIWNDRAGFWIRDRGRQVLKTTERSGSDSHAGCGTGFNMTCWVCLWGFSGCWCSTTASTRGAGWSIHWLALGSRLGGCHVLSDICNVRIVQRKWGGGDLTLDRRGYGMPCLRGIPLTSRYGNASLGRGKWVIPGSPTVLLTLKIGKISNI